LVEVVERRRGNDKTAPPIGKPFLRPGGMRASAFRRPLRGTACQIPTSSSCQFFPNPKILGFKFLARFLTSPERSLASPYLSGSPTHSAGPTHFSSPGARLSPKYQIFPDFGMTFSGPKKRRKNTSSQNAPKSQKSDPWVPKARFWNHFG
jgi:hypothetical protein